MLFVLLANDYTTPTAVSWVLAFECSCCGCFSISNHRGLHNNIIKISYHLCSAHAQRKSSHEGAHEQVEVVQAHALLVTNECTVPLLARPLQLVLSLVQFAVQVAFSLKVTMWKK